LSRRSSHRLTPLIARALKKLFLLETLTVFTQEAICQRIKPMIKFLEEERTEICNKIATYSKRWKQPVNLSKTVVQVFHSQVQDIIVDIYMEEQRLNL
jgi:hypothetical protein